MVVLLREAGVRRGSSRDSQRALRLGEQLLRGQRADAHAWVEVYFPSTDGSSSSRPLSATIPRVDAAVASGSGSTVGSAGGTPTLIRTLSIG